MKYRFVRNFIPTQSEKRGCGGTRWFVILRRAPYTYRGFDYPPYERQNDVTGTVLAPVTSPHLESDDVMTSLD